MTPPFPPTPDTLASLDPNDDSGVIQYSGFVRAIANALIATQQYVTSSGGGFGPATARTIANDTVDVAGLRYVLLDGEGSADDNVDQITGGVDGQMVVFESAGPEITFGFGTNTTLVDQEANSITLGSFVTQVFAIYSATDGKWQVWSTQVPRNLMSDSGDTEILTRDGPPRIEAFVNSIPAFDALARGFTAYVAFFLGVGTAAPADGTLAPAEVALWFDPTDGAAKLKIKGKSANGTVVTGEVALA